MEVFKVEDLSFSYPHIDGRERMALHDISFSLNSGEFMVICGPTGSGKSTLARMLKRELSPRGHRSGRILFEGEPIDELIGERAACEIGFVMQSPEQQIVTDKVWHELAFGLENMNMPRSIIMRRVAEMSNYFGIEDWFDKNVSELSGGQKQLLNMAAVMVMQPKVLILDEPTAQLDPIAASDFFATLRKMNKELALTIILIEHRLEEVLPESDRLIVLDKGELIHNDATRTVAGRLSQAGELMYSMPSAIRLYSMLHDEIMKHGTVYNEHQDLAFKGKCPLTIREGRQFVKEICEQQGLEKQTGKPGRIIGTTYAAKAAGRKADEAVKASGRENVSRINKQDYALEFKQVYYRYSREEKDVLSNMSFSVNRGELFCILGSNGSGKSTCLLAAAGVNKIYSGEIRIFGKKLSSYSGNSLYRECLACLPQEVETVFLKNTVREELEMPECDIIKLPFDITGLLDKHPYDLSGGEQQLIALAKILILKPKLILLDEPTKGLDAYAKRKVSGILKKLCRDGVTVIMVTHDVEFAAFTADRCAYCFRGEILGAEPPEIFFSKNSFYTTAVNRMMRDYFEEIVTVEEAVEKLSGIMMGRK